jgi:hypothetical protein
MARREPTTAGSALKGPMGPLMRQLRKFSAMRAAVRLLGEEFDGLAAPFDLRLAPDKSGDSATADTQTMYMYVSNKTVELALEKRRRGLITRINSALPYPMVEDLRFETTSPERIRRQMNILLVEPD